MKSIVIFGIDGCGKTTQAGLLKKALAQKGKKAEVIWLRGESYLTKPLLSIAKAMLRAPSQKKRGQPADEQSHQTYSRRKTALFKIPLARWLWRFLAFLDTWITLLVSKSKIRDKPDILIFDRYVYDTMIDIACAFGKGEQEISKMLRSNWLRFFPKPDLLILIDLDAEQAIKRKDDVPSISYLLERQPHYRLIADICGAKKIDGSKSVDEIASQILRLVEEKLA